MRSLGGCKCTTLSPKGDNTICPLFSLALPLKPGNCIKDNIDKLDRTYRKLSQEVKGKKCGQVNCKD